MGSKDKNEQGEGEDTGEGEGEAGTQKGGRSERAGEETLNEQLRSARVVAQTTPASI